MYSLFKYLSSERYEESQSKSNDNTKDEQAERQIYTDSTKK
jgi:hypothetical protein